MTVKFWNFSTSLLLKGMILFVWWINCGAPWPINVKLGLTICVKLQVLRQYLFLMLKKTKFFTKCIINLEVLQNTFLSGKLAFHEKMKIRENEKKMFFKTFLVILEGRKYLRSLVAILVHSREMYFSSCILTYPSFHQKQKCIKSYFDRKCDTLEFLLKVIPKGFLSFEKSTQKTILNFQKTKQRNTRTSVSEIIEFPMNQF